LLTGNIEVKNLDFDQDFPKIGTFPCPKFDIFGKPLGRATIPENFVGQFENIKNV